MHHFWPWTSLPLGPFSECTRGQTSYIKTNESSPFRVHEGTDYIKTKTNESSPGTLFMVRLHKDKDKRVFPWDTFQGALGDRLYKHMYTLGVVSAYVPCALYRYWPMLGHLTNVTFLFCAERSNQGKNCRIGALMLDNQHTWNSTPNSLLPKIQQTKHYISSITCSRKNDSIGGQVW